MIESEALERAAQQNADTPDGREDKNGKNFTLPRDLHQSEVSLRRRVTVHLDVRRNVEFHLDADTVYNMLWAFLDVSDTEVAVEIVSDVRREIPNALA